MANDLKRLRSILREYKLISESAKIPGKFQVIGIFCYVADTNFLKSLTPLLNNKPKENFFLYDILITDGNEKLKCFLDHSLGSYVQKNLLQVGHYIQIEKAKLQYLENEVADLHIVEHVILEDIKIIKQFAIIFPNLASLNFLESTNYREKNDIPLVTGRKYYLDPWVTILPYSKEWVNDGSLRYWNDNNIPQTIFLNDLSTEWRSFPKPYPPILVKVLARGNLHHYGSNQDVKPFPFVGFLQIGDSSGICLCVVLFEANEKLYYHAKPGTILFVQDYSIEETKRFRVHPRMRGAAGMLSKLSIEILIQNHTNIYIVPQTCQILQQQISTLPMIEFSFSNRACLEYAAEETTVDVVGLVTYVGRYSRFIYKYGKIHARYFIEMIDTTSSLPFRILIYHTGLRFLHEELHPGIILVATHTRVHHLNDALIPEARSKIFLKTSYYTEIYINHPSNMPYINYPAVKAIVALMQRNNEKEYIQKNILRFGGVQIFPPTQRNLNSYLDTTTENSACKLIPGAYWKKTLEDLVYRERLRITLGGFIIKITYVDLQTVDSSQPEYGWSYSSEIKSKQVLFWNIKAYQKLGRIPPLNLGHNDKSMFPSFYTHDTKACIQTNRKFPVMEAEYWEPSNESEMNSTPVLADGFYIISIASLHYQEHLECMMIPEPTAKPHPTALDALAGNFQGLPPRNINSFLSEPARYTLDEVKKFHNTAYEISDRTFVFAIELYKKNCNVVQAHLTRAFLCPPDQISQAMAADKVD